MYVRSLRIQNLKLIRDLEIDFTTKDGEPRPFTVFVGENGLCKTSILQAIALAASGAERANQLAEVASYPDLRRPKATTQVDAEFLFSERHHEHRVYPGLEEAEEQAPCPPLLHSRLLIEPGFDIFRGVSVYAEPTTRIKIPTSDERHIAMGKGSKASLQRLLDPLGDARGRNLNHWFVAGYGVGRTLPAPASVTVEEMASPSRDRLLSLFKAGRRIIGPGFADLLPKRRAEAYSKHLREALVEHAILPHSKSLTLNALGNIENALERLKAHQLKLDWAGSDLDVPTPWLSQGYQATMAWVADLIGQVWWEYQKKEVPLGEMEGICLIDEIDLHLHPLWQASLVPSLKAAFPRIQFITTTHSPMVLTGLEEDEIVRLTLDGKGNVVRKALPDESPALKTGSELYRTYFGVERLEPRALDDDLFRYGTLASFAGRSDAEEKEMRTLLDKLREHGVDPGYEPVPRARAKAESARSKVAKKKRARS
jgi:hypothetical protein